MCGASRPDSLSRGATRKVAILAKLTPSAQPRRVCRGKNNRTFSRMAADLRTEFGTGVVHLSLSLVRISRCRCLDLRQLRVVLGLRQVRVFACLSILFIGTDPVLQELVAVERDPSSRRGLRVRRRGRRAPFFQMISQLFGKPKRIEGAPHSRIQFWT